MLFIEGLTVSGFLGLDDWTLRFQTGLNVLISQQQQQPDSNFVIESLRWFFNCPETQDLQAGIAFTAQSYLEVRIRSDQLQHSFWELRGKKKYPSENVINLRRVMGRPHTVLVDGGSSRVPFEEFSFEMKQLGFRFGTDSFPILNVVRQADLDRLIKPASQLWKIVYEGLRVQAFRRLQQEEQTKKGFYRRQLLSTLTFDYQEKIDELKERIEASKIFRRLQKTLDMYAANVADREMKSYAGVLRVYESELTKSIAAIDTLEEKRKELEEKLDEHDSAVPETRELILQDLMGDYSDRERRLAMLQSEEQMVELIEGLHVQILSMVEKLLGSLEYLLGQRNEWIHKYEKVAKYEVELEIDENCLHALVFPPETRRNLLGETCDSLAKHLETSQRSMTSIQNEMEMLNLAVQECRKLLQITDTEKEHAAGLCLVIAYVEELIEISRNLCQKKLLTVSLPKDIHQKSTTLLQHVTAVNNITLESVQGLASIQHFLGTSNDSAMKQNLLGFVCQHLNFKVPTIATLAMPHLTDLLTLAVFHKQDVMMEMLNHLPSQHSYSVLALDRVSRNAESSAKVPSSVHLLSGLLVESPMKSILTHLMSTFYYTKVPYEEFAEEVDPEIVLIFVNDELVIGGGLLAGGWPLSAQYTLEKLSEAVSLQIEITDLELELKEKKEAIPKLEQEMDHIWNELALLREDSFDGFHRLLQNFPKFSEISTFLEQLIRQQTSLTRQQVRFDLLSKSLKQLKTDNFQDQAFYEQRINAHRNALAESKRNWHSYRKSFDKNLVQLKDDVRSLGELLVNAEALRTLSFPPKMHRFLEVFLSDFKDELNEAFQNLRQEHAGQQSAFDVLDQLDQVQQETIGVERRMLSYTFLLQELSAFYQELRLQFPASKQQQKTKANGKDLQYVYETRKKLNSTQPAYNLTQIERFKFKIELCRDNLQMLSAHRTPHVCNMTLPCVNKLTAIKLRLVTQMMAGIPSCLNKSGSLRLNFQYDRTKCSDDDFGTSTFNIENIVGLAVEFVDEEQNLIRYLSGDSATLAHLIFFACFLSVEGCKVLLLEDCFTGLSQEERQDACTLLLAISQNMQIFITAEFDD